MQTTFWARGDRSPANIPTLTPTAAPARLITFVPSDTAQGILLDYNMGDVDPETLVKIGGIAYQFSFQVVADLPIRKRDGASQVPDQFEGSTVFLIEVQGYPSDGLATRFFFLPEGRVTQADMEAFGNGVIDLQNVDPPTPGDTYPRKIG